MNPTSPTLSSNWVNGSFHILFAEAERMNLAPALKSPRGLFSITNLQGKRVFVLNSHSPLNSRLTASLSENKEVTHKILDEAGLPTIPYMVPENFEEVTTFFEYAHPCIAKPRLGLGATGVILVKERDQLESLDWQRAIFEEYVEGNEVRYMVVKGEVVAVQQRDLAPLPDFPWNKIRTGLPPEQWRPELVELAQKAAQVMGLAWVAVDFMIAPGGKIYILETNSSPSIRPFNTPDAGTSFNLAHLLLESIIAETA